MNHPSCGIWGSQSIGGLFRDTVRAAMTPSTRQPGVDMMSGDGCIVASGCCCPGLGPSCSPLSRPLARFRKVGEGLGQGSFTQGLVGCGVRAGPGHRTPHAVIPSYMPLGVGAGVVLTHLFAHQPSCRPWSCLEPTADVLVTAATCLPGNWLVGSLCRFARPLELRVSSAARPLHPPGV